MLRSGRVRWLTVGLCLWAVSSWGHFLVLLPSRDVVAAEGVRDVALRIEFTHPMECGPVMALVDPVQFGVMVQGVKSDLRSALRERQVGGAVAFASSYRPKRPGDHIFYMEPAPYWEPAEKKMIIHYTKVVVNAFGEEAGWDSLVGLPVEIEPLVRPYGLWTGNVFRGIVRREGKPVPFAKIEVEFWNEADRVQAPANAFVTQLIKADANGTFSYALPRAGWWGFAALEDGDRKLKGPDGEPVDVELGGLIWVRCEDMK